MIGIGLVEFLAIDRHAPLRGIVRKAKAGQLHKLELHFDPVVYTRQIRSTWRRRRASHDPLLHYLLIGWRELRAPNARLDPVFLGNEMRADKARGEPLLHILSSEGDDDAPQNEVETSRPSHPADVDTREKALIFHHGRGGGSTKFLAIFEDDLRRRGIEPVRLRLLPKSDRLVVWPDGDVLDLVEDAAALEECARQASIKLVVVSHIIDFDTQVIFDRLEQLVAGLTCRLWVILHDYFCVCPRVNLINSRGRLCPIPDTDVCASCVTEGGSEIGSADPQAWRPRYLAFLARADRVIVPSDDMRLRIGKFFATPLDVWRPELDGRYGPTVYPTLKENAPLSVAILGSLNEAKGSRLVLQLARQIVVHQAPIDIAIYGETDISRKLRSAGVSVKGRYRDSDLETLLRNAVPHIVLMPAIWPETWSFVLTTALQCGLPIMAFAHGAQFERLRHLGREEWLMPIDWIDKPERILASLMDFRGACLSNAHRVSGQHASRSGRSDKERLLSSVGPEK